MRSVIIQQDNDKNELQLVDRQKPEIGQNDLLIKVHYAGVNRTDIMKRKDQSGNTNHTVPGIEVSGTVLDANGSSSFAEGDRVMGLVNKDAYAEYAVMPEDRAMLVPETLSLAEGAAIPEVFLTAYQTLFWLGELNFGETVLIHAGASGVGTAAIQLAKQLKSARVIVTAGSQRKLEFCRELGADVLINYKEESFEDAVSDATNGEGAEVILDFIGAKYWDKNLASIKKGGRWVLIGVLGGSEVSDVNMMPLMSKYVQLKGTLLTPRSDAYKAELTKEFIQMAADKINNGNIRPVVDRIFQVEDVNEAHQYMENNQNIGKILLHMDSSES